MKGLRRKSNAKYTTDNLFHTRFKNLYRNLCQNPEKFNVMLITQQHVQKLIIESRLHHAEHITLFLLNGQQFKTNGDVCQVMHL